MPYSTQRFSSSIFRRGLRLLLAAMFFAASHGTGAAEKAEPSKENVGNTEEKPGRRVILRYRHEDALRLIEDDEEAQPYAVAVRLTSEMRRFGARRVILPDPLGAIRKEIWMAAAGHAATMGFEVRFEIDPEGISRNGHDVQAENSPHASTPPALSDAATQFETAILDRVATLRDLKTASGSPIAAGLFLSLTPPVVLPANWEAGLDEATFAEFLRGTGLDAEWSERLKTDRDRREFVKSRGLMPWLTWRSRRIARFYGDLAAKIHERHGLDLTVATPHPDNDAARSQFEEAERIGVSPVFAWRWMAFEPELWRESRHLRLISAESVSAGHTTRDWATHPDLITALGPQTSQGHWLTGSPFDFASEMTTERSLNASFDAVKTALIGHLSRHDVPSLIIDRGMLGDRRQESAALISRFEGLPDIGRKTWETAAQKPGLTLRAYDAGDSEFLVPINPLPCPISLKLSLVRKNPASGGQPVDPDSDLKLRVESADSGRATARLIVPPNHWGRVDLGAYRVETYSAELPEESRDVVRTRYDALLQEQTAMPVIRPTGEVAVPLEQETKSRGRRLMAALQAYRDMRLADFFRLSDSVVTQEDHRRRTENTARSRRDDLPNRRLIR